MTLERFEEEMSSITPVRLLLFIVGIWSVCLQTEVHCGQMKTPCVYNHQSDSLKEQKSKNIDEPIMGLSVGIDLFGRGINISATAYPLDILSIELSYGRDVFDYITNSDIRESAGINIHPFDDHELCLSIGYTNIKYIYDFIPASEKNYVVSALFGVRRLSIRDLTLFYRGGVVYQVLHDGLEKRFLPTIEVGLNINLL